MSVIHINIEKEKTLLILGRELTFRTSIGFSFMKWFEENKDICNSQEICLEFIDRLKIKHQENKINISNKEEIIEILNVIAKENSFHNIPVDDYDMFVLGLHDFYKSQKKELRKIAKGFVETFQENMETYRESIRKITEVYKKSMQEFMEIFTKEMMESIAKGLQEMPDNVRKMHDILTVEGWYLPLTIIFNLQSKNVNKIIELTKEDMNQVMIEFAKEIESDLLSDINSKFNNRYDVIKEALGAHKEGKYKLSIPIMLIQADGICNDIFTNYLFMNQKSRKDKVKEFMKDEYLSESMIFHPLVVDSAISANEYTRKNKEYYPFNRHEIIHGVDLHYGTEENSYRSIMLLKYLVDVNNYIEEHGIRD